MVYVKCEKLTNGMVDERFALTGGMVDRWYGCLMVWLTNAHTPCIQVLPGAMTGSPVRGEEGKKRCRVLFSYSAAHDDELSLEVKGTVNL